MILNYCTHGTPLNADCCLCGTGRIPMANEPGNDKISSLELNLSKVKEERDRLKEENQLKEEAIHEREALIVAFDEIRKCFEGRTWLMEGRGPYPYNDDRYKQEVRYLMNEFKKISSDMWSKIKSKSFEYRDLIQEPLINEIKLLKDHLIQINTHGEASWLIMELAEKWRSEEISDSKFREDARGIFEGKLKENRERVIEEVKKLDLPKTGSPGHKFSPSFINGFLLAKRSVLSLLTPKETPDNSGLSS